MLLFVMETKMSKKRLEDLQVPSGFAGYFAVGSDGLSGGIGLFWTAEVDVEIKNYSSGHIDAMVQNIDRNTPKWRFTGFYGEPRAENRHQSWKFLRTLYSVQNSAWLCMGDFNETMYNNEHFSRSARPEWQMRNFREAIEDCQLLDVGWSGTAYTWDNQQLGDQNIKARLDRAFANSAFLARFEHTRVRHIVSTESDHCFVLAELCENLNDRTPRGARQFRYENVWQTHVDYDKLVADNWLRGSGQRGLHGVVDALGQLQTKLTSWGAEEFGSLTRTVRKLRAKLERLRSMSLGRGPSDEERAIVKKLKNTLHQEEIWFRQRSRVMWLREGDRNTSYFHKQAAERKRINKIDSLVRADGSVCGNREENHAEVQGFFESLYLSQGFRNMDELLAFVQPKVSQHLNDGMDAPYTEEEVRKALFQMAPSKAPGVDGFTAGFFQRHWGLLKDDVVAVVLDFLNGGTLPDGMNDTSITLIPKVRHPQKISQYRPISLCSVLYKIGAK
jgi:hypothetical protein